MIGIPFQLLVSWILLRIVEKKDLNAIGVVPTGKRLKDFALGFTIAAAFMTVFGLFASQLNHNPFRLNEIYTSTQFFKSTGYVIISVLFEELIFRGALLYIAFVRLGAGKAMLLSATAFGIYHWFSFGIFGQPVLMIFVFLTTGLVGYVLAMGFIKTKSIYLAIAFHLGYNFVNMVIFSNDKGIGPQLLVKTFEVDPTTSSLPVAILVQAIYYLGFPATCWLYIRQISVIDNSRQ